MCCVMYMPVFALLVSEEKDRFAVSIIIAAQASSNASASSSHR